jgi:4a-hydroxytetrahydrobiopterin dehydratase
MPRKSTGWLEQKWCRQGLVILIASCLSVMPASLAIAQNIPVNPKLRLLSPAEVAQRLRDLPGWKVSAQQLLCKVQFHNFVESVAFVDRLVAPAEKAAHHPDLAIAYNQVTVSLSTHDAGGLTQQDFDLARTISKLPNFPGCQVTSQ